MSLAKVNATIPVAFTTSNRFLCNQSHLLGINQSFSYPIPLGG